MHCNFYIGQKVIAVPNNPKGWIKAKDHGYNVPEPGQTYTIRAIYLDPYEYEKDEPMIGVRLAEVVNPPYVKCSCGNINCKSTIHMELGFPHYEFRPATDISVFKQALEKV